MLSDVILDAAEQIQNAVVEYNYVGYSEEDLEKLDSIAQELRRLGLQLAVEQATGEAQLELAIDGEVVGSMGDAEDEDDLV